MTVYKNKMIKPEYAKQSDKNVNEREQEINTHYQLLNHYLKTGFKQTTGK